MASYKIYKHPTLTSKAVRQGFAWEVLLSPLTLEVTESRKRWLLWLILGSLIPFTIAVFFDWKIIQLAFCLADIMFFCYCGFNMYKWLEDSLLERGYLYVTSLEADGQFAALAQYRKNLNPG